MANAEGAAKVCLVCGRDCSSIARVKDTQGRYTCKECFDKAKAARASAQKGPDQSQAGSTPKPKVPAANDNAFLLDLAPPPGQGEGVKPCPNCGASMSQDAVLCVTCGYNGKTGQRTQVKVLKPEKERAASGAGGGRSFEINPAFIVIGLIVVCGGLLAWGTQSSAAAIAAVAIISLVNLSGTVLGIVQAFRQGDSLAGGLQVGAIFCGFLWIYTIYWMFVHCESGFVKAYWFTSAILGAALWTLVYLGPLGDTLAQAGLDLTN